MKYTVLLTLATLIATPVAYSMQMAIPHDPMEARQVSFSGNVVSVFTRRGELLTTTTLPHAIKRIIKQSMHRVTLELVNGEKVIVRF